MKLQRAPYLCGPLAVLNAARALGVHLTEREIRQHTGTTQKDGTNQWGILSALEKLGFEFQVIQPAGELGFDVLCQRLTEGYAAILSVEDGKHWVAAVGVIGDRIITFDSWMSAANKAECGVDVLNRQRLMRWWTPGDRTCPYSIVFKKGPR